MKHTIVSPHKNDPVGIDIPAVGNWGGVHHIAQQAVTHPEEYALLGFVATEEIDQAAALALVGREQLLLVGGKIVMRKTHP